MELYTLLRIGCIRATEDYKPFPKYDYSEGILPLIASCAYDFFQLSSLFLPCPITSIIFGIGRIYDLLIQKPVGIKREKMSERLYFFVTGVIASLGLGIVIFLIRIAISLLRVGVRSLRWMALELHKVALKRLGQDSVYVNCLFNVYACIHRFFYQEIEIPREDSEME